MLISIRMQRPLPNKYVVFLSMQFLTSSLSQQGWSSATRHLLCFSFKYVYSNFQFYFFFIGDLPPINSFVDHVNSTIVVIALRPRSISIAAPPLLSCAPLSSPHFAAALILFVSPPSVTSGSLTHAGSAPSAPALATFPDSGVSAPGLPRSFYAREELLVPDWSPLTAWDRSHTFLPRGAIPEARLLTAYGSGHAPGKTGWSLCILLILCSNRYRRKLLVCLGCSCEFSTLCDFGMESVHLIASM